MKNKTSKRAQRGLAWSETSDVNFGAYRVKRNRFAKRVEREGILFVHDAPLCRLLEGNTRS